MHHESVIGRRLSGALIFALALLVQLMLPFATARAGASTDDPLGPVVICAHGASADAAPTQPSDAPRPHCDHCTLCHCLGSGALLMPPIVGAIAAETNHGARLSWQRPRAATARLSAWPAPQPRGPPSLA